MIDYTKAIQAPFKDFKKLAIGGALYLIPGVNIITGLFAGGFFYNTAHNAMRKHHSLPEWDDWGDLFMKGLMLAVIGILYSLPVLIITSAFGGMAFLSGMRGGIGMFASMGVGMLLGSIIFVLTAYITPLALLTYVHKGRFADAFALSDIFRKAFTADYFVPWIITVAYAIGLNIIVGIISMITALTLIIPLIVGAVYAFVLGTTGALILGEVYQKL